MAWRTRFERLLAAMISSEGCSGQKNAREVVPQHVEWCHKNRARVIPMRILDYNSILGTATMCFQRPQPSVCTRFCRR